MDPRSLTDAIIQSLLSAPKHVKNRRAKESVKAKHKERNYDVMSDDAEHSFTLIVRQSTMVKDNYSCGLLWHASASQKVMLTRYNGSDHPHGNPIEGTEFAFSSHIHKATERYIVAGRKPEHFALQTHRYGTVEEALQCLVTDCNIVGLPPYSDPDIPETDPQKDFFL